MTSAIQRRTRSTPSPERLREFSPGGAQGAGHPEEAPGGGSPGCLSGPGAVGDAGAGGGELSCPPCAEHRTSHFRSSLNRTQEGAQHDVRLHVQKAITSLKKVCQGEEDDHPWGQGAAGRCPGDRVSSCGGGWRWGAYCFLQIEYRPCDLWASPPVYSTPIKVQMC